MDRDLSLQQADSIVAALVEKFDEIYHLPEAYVNEYFTSLRNEVDEAAERRLDAFTDDPERQDIVNAERTSLIEQLEAAEKDCLDEIAVTRIIPTESDADFRAALDRIREMHLSSTETQNILDEYANLLAKVENETLNHCCRLLKQKDLVFIVGGLDNLQVMFDRLFSTFLAEELFLLLLNDLKGTNLSNWPVYCYNRYQAQLFGDYMD